MGQRTRGRKFLLQCRYAAQANGLPLLENMDIMSASERVRDPETRIWIKDLGTAADKNLEVIRSMIEPALENWSMERLTTITRLILEQAIAETCYMEIPPAVAVKEAVLLAKEFEDPKTGSFVNGVLDRILFKKQN